jgi:hypothetical protein
MREVECAGTVERAQHRRDAPRIRLTPAHYRSRLRQPGLLETPQGMTVFLQK